MNVVIRDYEAVNSVEFCNKNFNTIDTLKLLTGKETCQKFLKSNETRILLSRIDELNEITTTIDVEFIIQYGKYKILISKATRLDKLTYDKSYSDFKDLISFIRDRGQVSPENATIRAYEIYKNAFGESNELTIWFTARMAVAGVFEQ